MLRVLCSLAELPLWHQPAGNVAKKNLSQVAREKRYKKLGKVIIMGHKRVP